MPSLVNESPKQRTVLLEVVVDVLETVTSSHCLEPKILPLLSFTVILKEVVPISFEVGKYSK